MRFFLENSKRCWFSRWQNIKNSKPSRMNNFCSIIFKIFTSFAWIKRLTHVKYQLQILKGVVPTCKNVRQNETCNIFASKHELSMKLYSMVVLTLKNLSTLSHVIRKPRGHVLLTRKYISLRKHDIGDKNLKLVFLGLDDLLSQR